MLQGLAIFIWQMSKWISTSVDHGDPKPAGFSGTDPEGGRILQIDLTTPLVFLCMDLRSPYVEFQKLSL